jgi:hypothetical protein
MLFVIADVNTVTNGTARTSSMDEGKNQQWMIICLPVDLAINSDLTGHDVS